MAANTVITSAETAAAQIEGNLLKAVSLEEAAYSRDRILGRNSDRKSKEFSSLPFTVTSTAWSCTVNLWS
jgi:hypothetical protein